MYVVLQSDIPVLLPYNDCECLFFIHSRLDFLSAPGKEQRILILSCFVPFMTLDLQHYHFVGPLSQKPQKTSQNFK